MTVTITHFIWGYQRHFAIAAESSATRLFQHLDERFDPEVFLVGIDEEDRADRFSACVEPEDEFWIASEAFNNIPTRAKEIVPTYKESEVFHTHPLAQQWHNERLYKRAIQDSILEVIRNCSSKPQHLSFQCSWPVAVDGFLVSVVLGLQRDIVECYPWLVTDSYDIHEYRSVRVPTSLIDACAMEYLADMARELCMPNAGAGLSVGKSTDEILRAAGQHMMAGVAYRADPCEHVGENVFDVCNRIAATTYERIAPDGCLVLARRDHPSLCRTVSLADPESTSNTRAVRKLLELAGDSSYLHFNRSEVWGLAEINEYSDVAEDIFKIEVREQHLWELHHADHPLMRVRSGLPELPKPPVDVEQLCRDFKRLIRGLSDEIAERLANVSLAASQERHGTMVVVSDNAKQESARLGRQAFQVDPFQVTPEMMPRLTPIDGAVLVDQQGVCHAIGVILDGLATESGSRTRGARFNSAVRYVETRTAGGDQCMAIVVSEDGGVSLVPELRPQVRRSEIDSRLVELKSMATAESVSRRRFSRIMEWIRNKRFYLLPRDCELVNELTNQVEAKLSADEEGRLRVERPRFEPNPEMDPDLYYEEE